MKSLSARLIGRTFVVAHKHVWCRPTAAGSVQFGLTERGLDDVGDVTSVQLSDSRILQLDWEGYTQTSADELYHTVWESVEGTLEVEAPVVGSVVNLVDLETEGEIDAESVLGEVLCSEDSLLEASNDWIPVRDYEETMLRAPNGLFAA